jgi:hypothetical protein
LSARFRRALPAVVGAAAAILLAAPAACAQYPSVSPPSWWIESLGPGQKTVVGGEGGTTRARVVDCAEQRATSYLIPDTHYDVFWGPPGSAFPPAPICSRWWGEPVPPSERGENPGQAVVECSGFARNRVTDPGYETPGPAQQSRFHCKVAAYSAQTGTNEVACQREQSSTGAPDQWVPRDCRPERIPGWPNRPTDVIVATTPPRASSSFPRQTLDAVRSRGLRIRVRSNEAGRVRAQLVRRGRVLRTITRALRANVRRELVLTLPAATRRVLRDAGSATFSVRLRVTDAAGNVRALSRAIVLRAAR